MYSPCCCPESCALCNLVEQPSWMGSSEIPDPSGYSPAPNGLTAWGWVVGVCAHVLGALGLAGGRWWWWGRRWEKCFFHVTLGSWCLLGPEPISLGA